MESICYKSRRRGSNIKSYHYSIVDARRVLHCFGSGTHRHTGHQERGHSAAVVAEGGKTFWMSKQAGGNLADVVSIAVYLTDPRHIDSLIPIRHEFWSNGNLPASTTITFHSLPRRTDMLEISAVAVINK